MELSWFQCLVYGLISGFAEVLPISAIAHQTVYLQLLGLENTAVLRFSACIGAFFALLPALTNTLLRLRRERKLASIPKNRRRRQPDFGTLMESRVFRFAAVYMLVVFLSWGFVNELYQRLWIMAIFLGINGIAVFFPQHLPGADKGAQSLSGLDTLLIGLAAGFGIVPGLSRVGLAASMARVRGGEQKYCYELALLLSLIALPALAVIYLIGSFGTVTVSFLLVLCCFITTLGAFLGGSVGIAIGRYMAVKTGFAGFGYYCWGMALFTLIIYLI